MVSTMRNAYGILNKTIPLYSKRQKGWLTFKQIFHMGSCTIVTGKLSSSPSNKTQNIINNHYMLYFILLLKEYKYTVVSSQISIVLKGIIYVKIYIFSTVKISQVVNEVSTIAIL